MSDFLKNMGLADSITTTMPISKAQFTERMAAITDEGNIGYTSGIFEVFTSGNNDLRGHITPDGFKVKVRRRFLDAIATYAVATGTLSESNGVLTIETEITGFSDQFIFFCGLLFGCYPIIFLALGSDHRNYPFPNEFWVSEAIVLFAMLCFIPNRSVKRLRRELEREFLLMGKTAPRHTTPQRVTNTSTAYSQPVATPETTHLGVADEIKKIKNLLDSGLITADEYARLKAKLLG